MKYQLDFAFSLAIASLSTPALAAEDAGGFIRVEAGKSDTDLAADTRSTIRGSDQDSSFSVRGGYFFSRNLAIEGFYSHYGEASGKDRFGVVDGGGGPAQYISLNRVTEEVTAIGLGVVGKTDFNGDGRGAYINGRAGFILAKTDLRWTSFSYAEDWHTTRLSDISTKPYVGVGVGYDFTSSFGLSLNCDWTKAELAHDGVEFRTQLQTLTVGAEFRF